MGKRPARELFQMLADRLRRLERELSNCAAIMERLVELSPPRVEEEPELTAASRPPPLCE